MGKTCEWSCPSCGGHWQLNVEHGMKHALPEHVAAEFPPEIGEEIMACAAREKWPVFHFNFRPARCSGCYSLVAAPHIEFPKQGKSFTGGCAVCRQPVACEEDEENILCPRCGKMRLNVEAVGHWD